MRNRSRWIGLIVVCLMLLSAASANAEVGGSPSNPPWLVAVFYTPPGGQSYMCSGTIIAPSVVLTAAHCAGGAVSSYEVIDNQQGNPEWAVSHVVVDPNYDPTSALDDVAILQLGEPTTGIASQQLATTEAPIGASAQSYGWGDTQYADGGFAGGSGEQGYVAPYTVADCSMSGFTLAPSEGCLDGSGTYSMGPGDSGGPVIVNGAVSGINDLSAGPEYDCMFTQVADVQPWLSNAIAALPGLPAAASPASPPSMPAPTAKPHHRIVKHRRYKITLRDLFHIW